jgi:Zn-dependent metalloprotease
VEQFLKDLPPQIDQLRARPAEKDWLGDVHVTLDAYRNGHRVLGGEQRRHVLADGSPAPKTSRDLSAVTFDDRAPAIDDARARALAREALRDIGERVQLERSELLYVPDGDAYQLVYEVDIVLAGVAPSSMEWRVSLDPQTGSVLAKANQMRHLDGTGKSRINGTIPLKTSFKSHVEGYVLEDFSRASLGTVHTVSALDADGLIADPLAEFTDLDNVFGNGGDMTNQHSANGPLSDTGQTSGVDAHNGMAWTWDLFLYLFKRPGPLANAEGMTAVVHSADVSSFWLHSSKRVYVARAQNGCPAQTDISTLGHELGHGFYRTYVTDIYFGEPGGINEATSDIIGKVTDIYSRTSTRRTDGRPPEGLAQTWPDWTIPICGSQSRNMARPSLEGDPDAWSDTTFLLGPHQASGPINRMFHFLAQGTARPGYPNGETSPFLPGGMVGIGIPAAFKIYYRAVIGYLVNYNPQFADLRSAMEQAATTATERQAVQDAFAAINVGPPADRIPPVVTGGTYLTGTGSELLIPASDAGGLKSVQYGTWGVVTAAPWSVTVPLNVGPGTRSLYVCAEDHALNRTCTTVTVIVDNSGPVISTFTLPTPLIPKVSRNVTIAAQDPAGIRSVELFFNTTLLWEQTFVNDPTSINMLAPMQLPQPLADGVYAIELVLTDVVGNRSTWVKNITWDKTKPTCRNVDPDANYIAGDWLNQQSLDSLTGIAGSSVLFDGASIHERGPCGAGCSFGARIPANATVGLHTVTQVCRDVAGNVATVPRTIRITLAPVVILRLVTRTHNSATFRTHVTDADGLHHVTERLECTSSGNHPLSSPVSGAIYDVTRTVSGLVFGETCELRVQAVDSLQVESVWRRMSFTVTWPPAPPPPSSCNTMVHSGGGDPVTHIIPVGRTSGFVDFDYDTYTVSDQLTLSCDGAGTVNNQPYATTFCVATDGWTASNHIPFNCPSGRIRVDVTPNCQTTGNTLWDFKLGCGY